MIQIKVRNHYFTNFMKCTNALNEFFSSGYQTKNFPMIEDDDDVEPSMLHILKMMDMIDPTWIDNPENIETSIEEINDATKDISEDEDNDSNEIDQDIQEKIDSLVAYKMLQFMSNHKSEFEKLLEGVYTLEMFTHPSKYSDVIEIFSSETKPEEINSDVLSILTGGTGYRIFDVDTFVNGIFHSEYIELPSILKPEVEINRVKSSQDRSDYEIIIDDRGESSDDDNDETSMTESYMMFSERAEVNFFEKINPPHIRYHEDSKKWQISKQFTAAITRLLAGLKTCDTVEDIEEFINSYANKINPDDYTCMVLPVILARVFDNKKKFTNRVFDENELKKYTDSYASIMKNNKGAQRFKNYDLFTVFKTDKEGTLQFLEDFLTLRLASDPNAYIKNHELMILFNIFDSRIYFDILYNVMPKSVQENEWKNEDNFVKAIRARLNANSRKSNPYDDATKKPDTPKQETGLQDMEEVNEFVLTKIKDYINIHPTEMRLCEDFHDLVHMECATLGKKIHDSKMSFNELNEYIGERFRPAINGELPNYIKTRVEIDKDDKDEPTVEEEPNPEGVPDNPIDELADSVETRANVFGKDGNDADDAFGSNADIDPVDPRKPHKQGQVVYNITYNNSFNKTTNDMSENKTVRTNSHDIKNSTIKGGINNTPSNSNNNGTPSATNTSQNAKSENAKSEESAFSTGKTVQEVFSMLYSEEPLFVNEGDATTNEKPKTDLLTVSKDIDRATLAAQQKAKRSVDAGWGIYKNFKTPIDRARSWLNKIVDNIIKSDEDKVKEEIVTNSSYRGTLYKASQMALKLGAIAVFTAINPYMGLIAIGKLGFKEYDKNVRLRKEVRNELMTEIEIINDRIKSIDNASYGSSNKKMKELRLEKERLIRVKAKLLEQAAAVDKTPIRNPKEFT